MTVDGGVTLVDLQNCAIFSLYSHVWIYGVILSRSVNTPPEISIEIEFIESFSENRHFMKLSLSIHQHGISFHSSMFRFMPDNKVL